MPQCCTGEISFVLPFFIEVYMITKGGGKGTFAC